MLLIISKSAFKKQQHCTFTASYGAKLQRKYKKE